MASASNNRAIPFTNMYYKRTVGTPKSCFVCMKETTTCLATVDVSDFLYTCPSHLTDTGFVTPIEAPKPTVSQEDIDRVKKEYEEKQKRKAEKSKDKDDKDKDSGKSKETVKSPNSSPVSEVKAPTKFTLHRKFFEMRIDAYKTKQAKEVAKQIPSLPLSLSRK